MRNIAEGGKEEEVRCDNKKKRIGRGRRIRKEKNMVKFLPELKGKKI